MIADRILFSLESFRSSFFYTFLYYGILSSIPTIPKSTVKTFYSSCHVCHSPKTCGHVCPQYTSLDPCYLYCLSRKG